MTGHELETKSLSQDRQDAINSYREAAKCWRDGMRRSRRSFAEDYSRGAIALFYHLKFAASSMAEDQWPFAAEYSFVDSMSLPMLVFHKEGVQLQSLDVRNQEFVFVHDVELVKVVEEFSVSSTVRLYDVQKSVCYSDDGLLLFSLTEERYKMVTIDTNRKVLFEPFSGIATDNFPPRKIKSTSEVVESVSDDKSEAVWHGLSRRDLNRIISGFSIRLDGDRVTTTLEEFSAAPIKIADVLVGPFEF